jgi:single-strand DNA-binding protein
MSINKAILIGNVGKDPEVKTIDTGRKVANFTLATTERGYTLQNGTQVPERTEWHNVIAWNGLAEILEKYVNKGSQLYVEGKITSRSWEKDGIKHYRTEIVADSIQMLGRKPEGQQTAPQPAPRADQSPAAFGEPMRVPIQQQVWAPIGEKAEPGNDDLPF